MEKLLNLLRAEGPQSPAQLISRLGISQPTLFRAAKARPEAIVALGAPRNRKLAALRRIRNLDAGMPIFRISAKGEVVSVGTLLALYPSSFAVLLESASSRPLYFPGLPFFLDDVRPQGYLGRTFAQRHADLGLPPRINDWSNDSTLEAMTRRGEDLVGSLLVGDESFERYQLLAKGGEDVALESDALEREYPLRAQAAVDGHLIGSSAGGEHPKFGATLRGRDGTLRKVLVKFSPSGESFAAERWRDLLICEWLSLEVLREGGISAAEGRIVEGGGRTFLETARFDRVAASGRRGILSLSALEDEWTGRAAHWGISAAALERKKKISERDLGTIRVLECFGRLIANSDRHPGNLSFFWEPGDERAALAPVYDMLPMLYAPNSDGQDTGRVLAPPTYDHTLLNAWKEALPLARRYWERVREEKRLSPGFRGTAERNLEIIG